MAGGSSGWQAPEQLFSRSGEEVRQGKSVDVFSFALVLFYCLTGGRHAFGESYERDFNIMQVPSLPSAGMTSEISTGLHGWGAACWEAVALFHRCHHGRCPPSCLGV